MATYKQGETVKITMTFTDQNGTAINMVATPTYEFYKRLKKEVITDTTATGLNLRSEANPATGVYEFLIDLPRLEADQTREILEVTAFGEDSNTIITSNNVKIEISRD
jgi:hypothetical protein